MNSNFNLEQFDAMMRKYDEGYYHRWYFDPGFYSETVVFENENGKHRTNVSGIPLRALLKRV